MWERDMALNFFTNFETRKAMLGHETRRAGSSPHPVIYVHTYIHINGSFSMLLASPPEPQLSGFWLVVMRLSYLHRRARVRL